MYLYSFVFGGDAFVGGFLSQLVKQKPIEECVRVKHSMLSSKGRVAHTQKSLIFIK